MNSDEENINDNNNNNSSNNNGDGVPKINHGNVFPGGKDVDTFKIRKSPKYKQLSLKNKNEIIELHKKGERITKIAKIWSGS